MSTLPFLSPPSSPSYLSTKQSFLKRKAALCWSFRAPYNMTSASTEENGHKADWLRFATGGLATMGACVFSNPFEVVKTRMQLEVGSVIAIGRRQLWLREPRLRVILLCAVTTLTWARLVCQGELQSKGTYKKHYGNFVGAFWSILRTEGIRGVQAGLTSGILYQGG